MGRCGKVFADTARGANAKRAGGVLTVWKPFLAAQQVNHARKSIE
ncbi:MAG: hypothetical protein ACLQBD_19355 [Syntrophobacteraceae bacterium]